MNATLTALIAECEGTTSDSIRRWPVACSLGDLGNNWYQIAKATVPWLDKNEKWHCWEWSIRAAEMPALREAIHCGWIATVRATVLPEGDVVVLAGLVPEKYRARFASVPTQAPGDERHGARTCRCSPSSGRARQRRFVLTIAANEGLGVRRAVGCSR